MGGNIVAMKHTYDVKRWGEAITAAQIICNCQRCTLLRPADLELFLESLDLACNHKDQAGQRQHLQAGIVCLNALLGHV